MKFQVHTNNLQDFNIQIWHIFLHNSHFLQIQPSTSRSTAETSVNFIQFKYENHAMDIFLTIVLNVKYYAKILSINASLNKMSKDSYPMHL
jgi:hypothetical protein